MEEKKQYHLKDLRRMLIEKGIQSADESGVENLSIREVASACGVSHGAPYSHFENKGELLRAMQEYITLSFCAELQTVIGHGGGIDDLGQAYIKFFGEHPSYFTFLFLHSGADIVLSGADDDEIYLPYRIFRDELFAKLRQTDCPAERYEDIALALLAQVHGIAALSMMTRGGGVDWQTRAKALLNAIKIPFLEEWTK